MSITEAAKPVIKKPDPKPFRTLHGQNLCDFQRNSYFIIVDDSISLPDLLHPRMWVNNKEKLKRFDTITFVSASGHLDVDVRVDVIAGGLPSFRVLRAHVAEVGAIGEGDHIAHNPELNLWGVFAGGEMVAEGLPDRAAAEAALREFRGGA